jgi:putative transcriptional regulator
VPRILFMLGFLALAGAAWSDDAQVSRPVFLVSKAGLADPNFHDSVVLLTHRGADGAIGVIVNHPSDVPLTRALPEFDARLGPADRLFFGGPVGPRIMSFVFRSSEPPAGALKLAEGAYASSSHDRLRELMERDKPSEGLRVFSGLAGWAPGQLEDEIDHGEWRKLPVDAHALFDVRPELLWAELDRRASATLARNDPAHRP